MCRRGTAAELHVAEDEQQWKVPSDKESRKARTKTMGIRTPTMPQEEESGRIVYNGQEMTLEEMGRQPLPDAVQEHYEEYLRNQ